MQFQDPLTGKLLPFAPHKNLFHLGRGGFGEVYRAEHWTRRHIAVKYLSKNDPECLRDFLAEIELLEQLSGVPGIVQILGKATTVHPPFFYMELCGAPLTKWIGRIKGESLFDLLMDVVRACKELDRRGIRHRDFKPSNILMKCVNGFFRPVISDFGIARSRGTARPCRGTGTPAYTAPEILRGEDFTPAADVYSLGITMWEMATGKPAIPLFCLNVPGNLASLLTHMCDADPARRPNWISIERELTCAIEMRKSPLQNAICKATGLEAGLALAGALLAVGALVGNSNE